MPTIIAIDPGASGGIAVSGPGNKTICYSMPKTEGDLVTLLKSFPADSVYYLENIVKNIGGKMPASAMVVYAGNWGFIKGVIQALGCELHLVDPQKWMKALGLGVRGKMTKTEWKNKLKSETQRLYPHLKVTLSTADALLILTYAQAINNATFNMPN